MKRLACLLTLAASPAFAHAFLTHANPPVGSTVAAPPAVLTLTYTEALEVPFCTVTVAAPSGALVQTGRPQPVPGHTNEITVPLHITAPGKYTVTWHALSVDTHKTEGSFSFTVAP
jgi:methionine-rich copper-binding protein CopC